MDPAPEPREGTGAGRDSTPVKARLRTCPPTVPSGRPRREKKTMSDHPVFKFKFAKVYPMYGQKAERAGRTKAEVEEVIRWLTGHDQAGLQRQIDDAVDLETFIRQAPALNPDRALIKGVVCGVRVEEVADPLMRELRYMDKLVDELAKGRKM